MIHDLPSIDCPTAWVQFTPCPNGPRPRRVVCTWIIPSRVLRESLLSSLTLVLYAARLNKINLHSVFASHHVHVVMPDTTPRDRLFNPYLVNPQRHQVRLQFETHSRHLPRPRPPEVDMCKTVVSGPDHRLGQGVPTTRTVRVGDPRNIDPGPGQEL